MRNRITGHWPICEECDTMSSDWDVYEQYESLVHEEVTQIQIALYDAILQARQRAWFTVEKLLEEGTDADRACALARCALEQDVRKLRLSARARIVAKLGTLLSYRKERGGCE
ncbi:MAG: hypothetical protein PHO92_03095 [Candidatus Peribacteraceae bacterium]|nr:hypothetical protein [Candidatus Peribacteraceae bacterium]